MRRVRQALGRWWQASLPRRLCADRAGNVMLLSVAMMIPLIALVGSGIDIGRVYVARSRMQQACDAASLAGRWAVASGASSSQVKAEALKYFNFNFRSGTMQTASFTPDVTVQTTGSRKVTLTATTSVPTTMMSMFGMRSMPLTVDCSAQQDFVNIDIVLVLDVTGSMADKATPSDSQSKMDAMRDAVLALYDQLAPVDAQLKAANLRLRYSIVPYSSTVNLGLAFPQDGQTIPRGMQASSVYQQCSTYNSSKSCYLKSFPHNAYWYQKNWNGCIEERSTVNWINASTTDIPAAAHDLDIDGLPDSGNNTTLWIPQDPDNEQAESSTACPGPAIRLTTGSRSDLQYYLNSLSPAGTTYHDIGLAWGARMISAGGVFSDSPTSYNGMPVTKYMIFMTDGQLNTDKLTYSAWGVEYYDRRTTPNGSDSANQITHQQRSTLLCNAIKNGGTSLWVVGFGTTLDPYMTNCASNPKQASTAGNSDELSATFTAIGKAIGALRLTE